MENPWLDICWDKTIPDCDRYYFALLGAKSKGIIKCDEFNLVKKEIEDYICIQRKFDIVKEKVIQLLEPKDVKVEALVNDWIVMHKIQLQTLPEPYTGDPESNVYLLNMNPGRRDEEFEKIDYNRLKYEMLTKLTLSHQLKHSMWYHMKGHDGYSWIRNKTNQLLKGTLYPRFFMIEYFPYHSEKGFEFPEYLPSYQYTNFILKSWFERPIEDKFLIILRNNEKWERRIRKIEVNSFAPAVLKNKRNVSLTRNNIILEGKAIDFEKLKKLISYEY